MSYSVFIVFLTTSSVLCSPYEKNIFKLSVIHINDFHARFNETSDSGFQCVSEHCIGGFSRMYQEIKTELKQNPDALLLNAGDNYQGTIWYTMFKWNITQYFFNKLPFTAMTLGNHEFDDGASGLVPFIQKYRSPIIVSNIDVTLEPSLDGLITKSIVIEKHGKKIGIIGVITKTTQISSNVGNMKFFDESESVNAEAERLVKDEGVFTNIVLSHSGYHTDKIIAKNATGRISLIVGGHSHSLLYTGDQPPGPAAAEGPYPTIVESEHKEKILIVQASCFARYVGHIDVYFDQSGNIKRWEGQPVFLDTTKPQDPEINDELNMWGDRILETSNLVLGGSLVDLGFKTCLFGECTLGNFVTDAMVYSFVKEAPLEAWTSTAIAIMNAGGLRHNISKGNITYNDLVTALPYENMIVRAEISGKDLKQLFEITAIPRLHYTKANLLQVSGIHVVYDLLKPEGAKVKSLKVRCQACPQPRYSDVIDDETYPIALPSFLSKGSDGFALLRTALKNRKNTNNEIEVYSLYLKDRSPIFSEVEGRIEFIEEQTNSL